MGQLDAGHEVRRRKLAKAGGLLSVGGGAACLFGLVAFIGGPLLGLGRAATGGEEALLAGFGLAALGFVAFALGGFALVFGLALWLFGSMGKVQRFVAAETMPVGIDLARQAAPVVGELAQVTREGWERGRKGPTGG